MKTTSRYPNFFVLCNSSAEVLQYSCAETQHTQIHWHTFCKHETCRTKSRSYIKRQLTVSIQGKGSCKIINMFMVILFPSTDIPVGGFKCILYGKIFSWMRTSCRYPTLLSKNKRFIGQNASDWKLRSKIAARLASHAWQVPLQSVKLCGSTFLHNLLDADEPISHMNSSRHCTLFKLHSWWKLYSITLKQVTGRLKTAKYKTVFKSWVRNQILTT